MAQEEEALPPWGALPADMLQGVFAALPDAASRGACRRVCRHWRQVADQGPEVWQSVHCRCPNSASYLRRTLAPTEAGEPREPARRRATVEELSALLSRQRVHLRRLTLEENAGAWEDDAAQGLAAVLTAAAGDAGAEGSGLTDLTLVVAEQLPHQLMEVLPGGAVHLTSLVLRPLRGHVPSLHWEQFGSRLQQLHSVSLTGRLPHFETSDSLRQLTALTRLRLANAHNLLPDVSLALLAWPSSLVRLELSGLSIRLPNPQQLVEMGGLDLPAPALALIQQLAQQMAGLPLAQPPAVGVQQQVAAAQGQPAAAAGQAAAADQAAAAPAQPAAGQAAGPPGQPAAPAPPPLPVAGSIGASLLPHWQRLEHLRLHNCELDGSLVTVLPHLPQLTMLQLSARVPAEAAMAAVQRCSRLQELVTGRLTGVGGATFQLPPAPGTLAQLTRLRFSGCDLLSGMDAAWCSLPSLLSFEVESCDELACPNLAGLTKVEQLVFSHQRLEELPESITGLTTLTRLAVAACSLETLRPGPYLRGLRELNLFANGLSTVPEALVHPQWRPTALQLLDMSSNHSHFLSDDDVEVLSQLTTLTSLRLSRQEFVPRDAHPAAPLAALRAALPHCQIDA